MTEKRKERKLYLCCSRSKGNPREKVRVEDDDEMMDVRRRGKTIAAMSAQAVKAKWQK